MRRIASGEWGLLSSTVLLSAWLGACGAMASGGPSTGRGGASADEVGTGSGGGATGDVSADRAASDDTSDEGHRTDGQPGPWGLAGGTGGDTNDEATADAVRRPPTCADGEPPPPGPARSHRLPVAGERVPRREPATGCHPSDSPRIGALRARAEGLAERSFRQALARRGLRPLSLGRREVELHRGAIGMAGPPVRPGGSTEPMRGPLVRRQVDGRWGWYVVGEVFWGLSGSVPEPAEFVLDEARGRIFRLRRRPHRGRGSLEIHVCGCRPPACRFGSGCPACGSTVQRLYGPLPDGVCYAGELTLDYEVPEVQLVHEGGSCGRCPPPPPSVPR